MLGLKLGNLLPQQLPVGAGGQAHHLKLLGKGAHHIQGLPANGAGGAEDDYFFHFPAPRRPPNRRRPLTLRRQRENPNPPRRQSRLYRETGG